jgi:hypothetical protein
MPIYLKFIVYFAILGVLVIVTNSIPRGERELGGLVAFMAVGWMIGGLFIVARAAFRFITR